MTPHTEGESVKYDEASTNVTIPTGDMIALARHVLQRLGCNPEVADCVTRHLVEADLMGVESHGIMRLMQYAEQFESGYMKAGVQPELRQNGSGAWIVDGNGGIGMPAMQLAVEHGSHLAKEAGLSVTAIINCGHTGRLGAFTEAGANAGCLTICVGGGGRQDWRMVTPHGGATGMLPTNPYSFSIPGGRRGPVVLDFATSRIAGGWIYAAKIAGTALPDDAVVDAKGNPTRDPEDYFNGGAILPAAGAKGYGLAVLAELVGEALLGPVTTEMNWLLICVDTKRYSGPSRLQDAAEEVLQELRVCPPAPGFDRVEIPGERERERYRLNVQRGLVLPTPTWERIGQLAPRLKIAVPDPIH